jgi:N-acetylmuramoyl-L-alanine amidase
MPAVLIEPAFISSEHDEKLLADHTFRDQIAAAIANGVQRANQE